MNHKDYMLLRRLIVELDDTSKLYSRLGCALDNLYGKGVVERIVQAHRAISADLVEHMRTMGVKRVRRSSMLDKLGARYTAWCATTGANAESDCLVQIASHEAQILEHFQQVADHVAGLKQRMHHHLRSLKDASAPVTLILDQTRRGRQGRSRMEPPRSNARTTIPISSEALLVFHDSRAAPGTRRIVSAGILR